jgi:hypothetical protein
MYSMGAVAKNCCPDVGWMECRAGMGASAHSLVFLPLLAETFGVLVRIPERRHTIIDFAALPGTTTWRSLLAHHLAHHSDRRSDVAP